MTHWVFISLVCSRLCHHLVSSRSQVFSPSSILKASSDYSRVRWKAAWCHDHAGFTMSDCVFMPEASTSCNVFSMKATVKWRPGGLVAMSGAVQVSIWSWEKLNPTDRDSHSRRNWESVCTSVACLSWQAAQCQWAKHPWRFWCEHTAAVWVRLGVYYGEVCDHFTERRSHAFGAEGVCAVVFLPDQAMLAGSGNFRGSESLVHFWSLLSVLLRRKCCW